MTLHLFLIFAKSNKAVHYVTPRNRGWWWLSYQKWFRTGLQDHETVLNLHVCLLFDCVCLLFDYVQRGSRNLPRHRYGVFNPFRDSPSRLNHRGDSSSTTLPWRRKLPWFIESRVNDPRKIMFYVKFISSYPYCAGVEDSLTLSMHLPSDAITFA